MLHVLVNISLEKFCCRNRHGAMQKKKRKKKEKKNKLKKMDTKISGVLKTMGTNMPAMKKNQEIAPALANISSFNKRDMFSRSKVELA